MKEDVKWKLSTPTMTNNNQSLSAPSLLAPRLRSWSANPRIALPPKPLVKNQEKEKNLKMMNQKGSQRRKERKQKLRKMNYHKEREALARKINQNQIVTHAD